MHPNEALIHRFYTCFQARDGAGMAACYHPNVRFSDAVFIGLEGERAGAMWQMLCERGKDLTVEFRDVVADDRGGSAHWDARYTFSTTGRRVLNRIDARFDFDGGKIIGHRDAFDFPAWAKQALGPVGWLFGWSGMLQRAIQKQALKGLDAYIARRAR